MTAALESPWAAPPVGGWRPVAPGVHWLRLPLPFALDHINLWLLEDGDGWTVVDTGLATADSRQAWEHLFAQRLNGRSLRRIVITHYHPDHYGLAQWLQRRTGATVHITPGEQTAAQRAHDRSDRETAAAVLGLYASHGLAEEGQRLLGSQGNRYRGMISGIVEATVPLHGGERIRIGGREWEILIGRGHAPEHACLYSADDQLLISGDQILPRISSNVSVLPHAPEEDPLRQYLESLDTLAALPADTLTLPAHGDAFHGLHQRIEALHAHHRDRLAALLESAHTPVTAAEMLPVLFRRPLDGHALFFAMGEAIAHLNRLWHDGRLQRQRDRDGVYRFSTISP